MPADLRQTIEEAARRDKRSLNAEIVARLEASALKEVPLNALIPASKAREMASVARRDLSAEVRKEIFTEINYAASKGHGTACINLQDYDLESMTDEGREEVLDGVCEELKAAEYELEWDGNMLWVSF